MNLTPWRQLGALLLAPVAALLLAGCQSTTTTTTTTATPAATTASAAAATTAAPAPAASAAATTAPVTGTTIRIKAGASAAITDSQGHVWAPDQGFSGGDTVDRPDLTITNTPDQAIYRSEHYSMDSFSTPVANGKYLVKLHFAETYDGITGPGQRVFSFTVQGHQFKDFDVWAKAGGPYTAYVESVPVEITDGKLTITFASNVENPQINGIEILPQ
jgi:hypothetical protein